MEKLKQEYKALEVLWDKLTEEWEQPSDYEDLYRIYPLLTTTGAIVRKYISWHKNLNLNVSIVKPSLDTSVDTSEYLYYDEKTFFNGEKKNESLWQVASTFLHQTEYVYMDDRKSDGKVTDSTNIYLYVKSDRICKSCALANNGELRKNGNDYQKKGSFISYSDCLCGYYINMKSYMRAIKDLINECDIK